MRELVGKVVYEINEIDETDWNRCANPIGEIYNPFVDYRFLRALEVSGSVSNFTGWQPFHLLLEDDGATLAAMPLYLKSHSRGEFVFDGGWAHAWERAGGNYYPKLQCSIPFTPATGPRLLACSDEDQVVYQHHLLQAAIKVAQKINVSSLHITFLPQNESEIAQKSEFLQRVDTQYHWKNAEYETFDEFLSNLSAKKRKNLRRERREAVSNGIEIEWVTGSDLQEHHWDAFYDFYTDTGYRKWGTPYLTREFFSEVSDSMPEQTLLILAKRNNHYIAGAINFIGGDTLFGRHWGCSEWQRFLHFEVCYYQAIDFAIANNLTYVEAGAQGGHKFARGYMPRTTYSSHWIADPSLRRAVEQFLGDESHYVQRDIDYLENHSPYRNDLDLSKFRLQSGSIV